MNCAWQFYWSTASHFTARPSNCYGRFLDEPSKMVGTTLTEHVLIVFDREIQFQDTPDAAKRPTTMRTVLTAQVYSGNPMTFLDKLNQEFHYEYILRGHRLIYNNVILTLFQIFKVHVVQCPRKAKSLTIASGVA